MKGSYMIVFSFTLSIIFFIMVSPFGKSETENSNILYVSKALNGSYTFIQDAINNASDGDTIIIYNGIYEENIVINKSINLIGMDSSKTIINGNAISGVIILTAGNVLISNFTIENTGIGSNYNGINIKADHCTIMHNTLVNNSWSGIKTGSSCKNITIKNNIFKNNGYGVFFDEATMDISILENNFYDSSWDGIYLDQSDYCLVKNNIMETCGDDGISLIRSNNIEIYDNIVIGSKENGIYLFSSETKIKDNNIINNINTGVFFRNSDNSEIYFNEISGNKNGIGLTYSSANNNIYDNDLSENLYGIYISSDAGNNQILNNSYFDNTKDIYNEKSVEGQTPGFEFFIVLISIMFVIFIKKYKFLN